MPLPTSASTVLRSLDHISRSYLYWTNTAVGTLNRIKIEADGTPVGTSEVVVSNVPKADDFISKSDGSIWVAQNQMDALSLPPAGARKATVVAGSNISTTLAGVTSGHFGRISSESDILYLATSGGKLFSFSISVSMRVENSRLLI